jgi:AcrR family transcriptional regulator
VARAQTSLETEQKILEAATKLLGERYYDEVTLDEIAREAGVATKTVLRRFGTKEAIAGRFLEAAGKHNQAWRDSVAAGDVDGALRLILEMYELFGDAALRNLALEGRVPMVTALAEKGRELHTEWVARVFSPLLSEDAESRRTDLALLLVATDVYTWKLLRRDRRFTATQTATAVRRLVDRILNRPVPD